MVTSKLSLNNFKPEFLSLKLTSWTQECGYNAFFTHLELLTLLLRVLSVVLYAELIIVTAKVLWLSCLLLYKEDAT